MTGDPVGLVEFLQARLDDLATPRGKSFGSLTEVNCPCGQPCGTIKTISGDDRITVQHGAVECVLRNEDAQRVWEQLPETPVDAYTLADVEAKRRIIESCAAEMNRQLEESSWLATALAQETLELLALPFKDHPDWQEQWNV